MKVSIDTRTLEPGDIFIPIKGPNFDGTDFINEAINKGAKKILNVDIGKFAANYRKKLKCKVIAVTGSAGKTTIKDMLYHVLKTKYNVIRSEENQNNEIGVPLNILKADATTDILILELAMRQKGEIKYLTKMARPTHVVISNIGLTHIELLKTQRKIALAKAEIFQPVLKWEKNIRSAFLNFNTPFYNLLHQKAKKNDYHIFPYETDHNIETNLNLCYLIGKQFGLTENEINTGLSQFSPSLHRLNIINIGSLTIIDDTYNANPDGVRYALTYQKKFNARKIFVFGDMLELGVHSKKEHNKIIDSALDAGVEVIFTYGEKTAKLKSKKITILSFKDKKKLCQMLKNEIKP
ncbi:UDP-N-acetylmuramoyl-tripeptide--D-alanyl-D-alanine ligase, partial [Candidatus Margulisiibacteriota bacterium]